MSTGTRVWVVVLALVALVLAASWPTLDLPFLEYDDDDYVTQNPHVQRGLDADSLAWAFTSAGQASNWHPLTWVSHMVDLRLFGLNSRGHHFMNLLLHAAGATALFAFLLALTGAMWRSAVVVALWSAHPLLVESVARVAERKDVLSGLLWMLTLLAYVRYARRPGSRRYLLLILAHALGLMAKPTAVTLPFVLWLLDFWPLGRTWLGPEKSGVVASTSAFLSGRYLLIAEKIPLLALSAAASAATYVAQERGGMMAAWQQFSLQYRVANAVWSYAAYLGRLVWPAKLSPLYPHRGGELPLPAVLLVGALLLAVSVVALMVRRRGPHLFVGWFWYVGVLVPMIGLVQVGVQGMADRYAYLPSVGVLVAVVWSVRSDGWGRTIRGLALVVVAGVLAFSVAASRTQARFWASDLVLYQRALSVTSRNWLAEYNVGVYLGREDRNEEAIAHYEASLRIFPGNPNALTNLGTLLARQGRDREAIRKYRQALEILPGSATVRYNLGNALGRQGELSEAIEHYRQAIRVAPDHFGAHTNLGAALFDTRRFIQAADSYRQAVRIQPDSAEAHYNLGLALEMSGVVEEALPEYRRSLNLKADHPGAGQGVARILARRGRTR